MELDSAQASSSSRTQDTDRRSSARLRATKSKEDVPEPAPAPRATRTRTRSSFPEAAETELSHPQDKGKAKATDEPPRKKPRRSQALTIIEPPRDPKGKKRAAPEPESDEDAARKRARYSLRTRKSDPPPMTRKGRATTRTKSAKKDAAVAPPDNDIEMADAPARSEDAVGDEDEPDEDDEDEDGGDDDDGADDDAPPEPNPTLELFGMGAYMSSLAARLKTILNNIKPAADATQRLIALQELSELLSISTEDMLAGHFQVDAFVKELVGILGGGATDAPAVDADDEDAALAAALAASAPGGGGGGDESLEAQLLACRCLANLMEALPGCAHTVVYHGAVPVLCGKLRAIEYIDLAEQTLSTLEKISEEYPSAVVREGGLAALLDYLDFFSTTVQRTALQAASNCCRNAGSDSFPLIRDVLPTLRRVLGYADARCVEYAVLCVIRLVESFHRSAPALLETVLDAELIRAVHVLLLPAGGSPLVSAGTYTLVLRALGTAARASPRTALALLEADVAETLFQILSGVAPAQDGGPLADMVVMQNLANRPKDQVEEALALISELMPPLPKDGVFDHRGYTEKSLARLAKAKSRADRASTKGNPVTSASAASSSTNVLALADDATPGVSGDTPVPTPVPTPAPGDAPSVGEAPSIAEPSADASGDTGQGEPSIAGETAHAGDDPLPVGDPAPAPEAPPVNRTELLRANPAVVERFMRLIVPVLVDVYSASVTLSVRTKSLTALLKALAFMDGDGLCVTLQHVAVASFAGSVLSSRDHPTLVIGALQVVELLLAKAPDTYRPPFRRDGVLHEIEALAQQELVAPPAAPTAKDNKDNSAINDPPPPPAPSSKKVALDPADAVTLRARVLRFRHLASGPEEERDEIFLALRALGAALADPAVPEKNTRETLAKIAACFAGSGAAVSSFELLQSGLVSHLLEFATTETHPLDISKREKLLSDMLGEVGRSENPKGVAQTSAFATLVKRLQEGLTRMESFEVITVSQGADDARRTSASMLARQLRLRLVAEEGSDIPRGCANIIVSIHAIATFQALNDYLRPRVAGAPIGVPGRLAGMLAALAGVGAGPGPSSSAATHGSAPASTSAASGSALGSSSIKKAPQVGRRRSLRLAKKDPEQEPEPAPETHKDGEQQEPAGTEEPGRTPVPHIPDVILDHDIGDDFGEDDFEADVLDEEMDRDADANERTVTVAVGEGPEGLKVVAQTPDGTRVATPNPLREGPSASGAGASPPKPSYAAALKSKTTDWHLVFSMDDNVLPLDMTVYGAIHQHELRKASGGSFHPNTIWQGMHTVKFKKVPGPPTPEAVRSDTSDVTMKERERSASPSVASTADEPAHMKILRLLRVLQKLNIQASDVSTAFNHIRLLPDSAFVNNKLTAKLTRQLEEPMIVASSCLPDWAVDLPQNFPFLFPFTTRYSFLQATSFGYARLILKWQSQQARNQDTNSRRDDTFNFLGRLQRQKVRISRKHILESAVKVFELYGAASSILEVEYFEEVGTGLGPTLEFYSLVSREFARRDLKIWRDADSTVPGPYVHHPLGLFPAPVGAEDLAVAAGPRKRAHIFRVIGQFVAKALLDSRIIDMSFNKVFMKLVLDEEVPLTIDSLELVDPALAKSLKKVQAFANAKRAVMENGSLSPHKRSMMLDNVCINGSGLEDLGLDFTVPGYDLELTAGGRDQSVTVHNVDEYLHRVMDVLLGEGVRAQAEAFREGFSKVFPITDLQICSADELVVIFGNSQEDWSTETLNEALKADHGFNVDSRAVKDLIAIMSDYDTKTRREYLQFITGSPKLPIGGFRGLNPPFTVVRKPHEPPLSADDYLPSVMTCVNYLKLPEYSSRKVMAQKLRVAMKEGVGSFHLS